MRRICPFCGKEGITLYLGGYIGRLYKCPNCQYVGPLVLEGEYEDREATTFHDDDKNLADDVE